MFSEKTFEQIKLNDLSNVDIKDLKEEETTYFDKEQIMIFLKEKYNLKGVALKTISEMLYEGNNGLNDEIIFDEQKFLNDVDNQIKLLVHIFEKNGTDFNSSMEIINHDNLIQSSYNELINKLAILNRFDVVDYNGLYFLRNGLFNEKELFAILTEFENYAINRELYGIYGRQIINSKKHIEFLTDKYRYSKKAKLVNLYNLSKKLKENNIVMTYKDK